MNSSHLAKDIMRCQTY